MLRNILQTLKPTRAAQKSFMVDVVIVSMLHPIHDVYRPRAYSLHLNAQQKANPK
jgi:hypothetical protein